MRPCWGPPPWVSSPGCAVGNPSPELIVIETISFRSMTGAHPQGFPVQMTGGPLRDLLWFPTPAGSVHRTEGAAPCRLSWGTFVSDQLSLGAGLGPCCPRGPAHHRRPFHTFQWPGFAFQDSAGPPSISRGTSLCPPWGLNFPCGGTRWLHCDCVLLLVLHQARNHTWSCPRSCTGPMISAERGLSEWRRKAGGDLRVGI